MPLNVADSTTWVSSSLASPGMPYPIRYWQLADPDAYDEEFVDGANQITTLLAVDWDLAAEFRWYAMGFAERLGGEYFFRRYVPLLCPYSAALYLVRLKKYKVHAGIDDAMKPVPARPDPYLANWFNMTPAAGDAAVQFPVRFPPRIVYLATFANLGFDVVDQDQFQATQTFPQREHCRYVSRRQRIEPKVRKIPNWGFYVEGQPNVAIDEVGFVPYSDSQLTLTWFRVPYGSVPWTAIEAAANHVNLWPFDYKLDPDTGTPYRPDGTLKPYGRFREGDLLFEGLARDLEPYRGPNSEWLADVPFTFRFQAADRRGDGMLKIPRNDGTWVRPVARGTGPGQTDPTPRYMYEKFDFDKLFRPEA